MNGSWKLGIAIAAGATSLAHGAEHEARFDLVCTHQNGNPGVHLVIDLEAKEWCMARTGCTEIEPIVNVTSGKIVLEDEEPKRPWDRLQKSEVNRITGEYHNVFRDGNVAYSSAQACEVREFSGLGDGRAKF